MGLLMLITIRTSPEVHIKGFSINPNARFLPSLNVYWSYFEQTRRIVEESLMEIFEHHKST